MRNKDGGKIMQNLQRYAKFWIAAIGLGLMGLDMFFGIRFGFDASAVYGFAISIAVALGVITVPNKP